MRQGIGVVLVLILLLIGAGLFVVTAVSLRSSVTASAATLSVQPASSGEAVSVPAKPVQPMDTSSSLSTNDAERENINFFRADHQGVCDGDKGASSAGY